MTYLSTEHGLLWSVVATFALWLLGYVFLAMHGASQSLLAKYRGEEGTVWGFLRTVSRLAWLVASCATLVSVVLNIVRVARHL